MKSQNGIAPIVGILGIVVLIALVGGAFYVGRAAIPQPTISKATTASEPNIQLVASQQPSVMPNVEINDNWKVYQDQKYPISFRYPQEWQVKVGNWNNERNWNYGDKVPVYAIDVIAPAATFVTDQKKYGDTTNLSNRLTLAVFQSNDIKVYAETQRRKMSRAEGSGEPQPELIALKPVQCGTRSAYVLYVPGGLGEAYTLRYIVPLSSSNVLDVLMVAPDWSREWLTNLQEPINRLMTTLSLGNEKSGCDNPFASDITKLLTGTP